MQIYGDTDVQIVTAGDVRNESVINDGLDSNGNDCAVVDVNLELVDDLRACGSIGYILGDAGDGSSSASRAGREPVMTV